MLSVHFALRNAVELGRWEGEFGCQGSTADAARLMQKVQGYHWSLLALCQEERPRLDEVVTSVVAKSRFGRNMTKYF